MRTIAIIGTAGRDKQHPMNRKHWEYMCHQVSEHIRFEDHLVSGGAAWADHVAVWAYRNGLCDNLTLHLPAPFNGQAYAGGYGTSGGAANYYHGLFSRMLGIDSLWEIQDALRGGAQCTHQPEARGYAAMANRNRLVAEQSDTMLAFTFGSGPVPADGGTRITWDMARPGTQKQHFTLLSI